MAGVEGGGRSSHQDALGEVPLNQPLRLQQPFKVLPPARGRHALCLRLRPAFSGDHP